MLRERLSGTGRPQLLMGPPPLSEILTAKDVAEELRCSKAQVYRLMNGSVRNCTVLPHIALGRKRVIRRSSLEAWKLQNEVGGIGSDDHSPLLRKR